MKVVYLHGYESIQKGKKNEYLHDHFKTYDPTIDYSEKNIFKKLYSAVKRFNPDLIIGSSMGGRFAYHIGNLINVPTLLFNPALVTKNDLVNNIEIIESHNDNHHTVVLGKNDKVVIPQDTIEYLNKHCKNHDVTVLEHKHRTSYKLFVDSISVLNEVD